MGRRELDKVQPHHDRDRLVADLAEAGEAIEYLRLAARPQPAARGAAIRIDFGGLPDTQPAVHKLHIEGASLEPKEIFDLFALLDRAADAKSVLTAAAERFPRLGRARRRPSAISAPLLQELDGKILPDGSVADHASVALNRLRRDIERQKKSIQESLERFLRAHREEGVLQEEFVTIRNERFVVPDHRRAAPQARRRDPRRQLQRPHALRRAARNHRPQQRAGPAHRRGDARSPPHPARNDRPAARLQRFDPRRRWSPWRELELIFAKARFAAEFDCVIPRFGDAPAAARRAPSAARRRAAAPPEDGGPDQLELDEQRRTLLISGPNTGGKTVTLKTVGLLALMAQSGDLRCPRPRPSFRCSSRCWPISATTSRSRRTSARSPRTSRNIREMALDVTPDSLVLLDELGAATDPEEGGALGVAIVEHFRAAGAFTLVSTHLMALKIYGASTEGVVNGSMGFDEQTFEPTYELRLGLPGQVGGPRDRDAARACPRTS